MERTLQINKRFSCYKRTPAASHCGFDHAYHINATHTATENQLSSECKIFHGMHTCTVSTAEACLPVAEQALAKTCVRDMEF